MNSTIFIKKNQNNTSALSSDLPSKFELSDSQTSLFSPKVVVIDLSATSPSEPYINKTIYDSQQTSPYEPHALHNIGMHENQLSQTSPDINDIKLESDEKWKNQNYYFAQIDMDIAWMDKKNDSDTLLFGDLIKHFGKNTKIPLPVVSDYNKAVDVGHKICKYAYYANDPKKRNIFPGDKYVKSSVEKDKYSYPLFGSVIFTMKFKEKPKIVNLGTINKSDYKKIFDYQNSDLVLYTTSWDKKDRAIIFNISKLDITDIDLKTFDCALGGVKGSAMLKILSSSSNENRFSAKYVNLLEKLCTEGGHISVK